MAILKLLRFSSSIRDPLTLAASSETASNRQGGDPQPFTTLHRWIPKRLKTWFDSGKVELAQVSVTPAILLAPQPLFHPSQAYFPGILRANHPPASA